MSAASVSRTGFPFSQLSATASSSRLSSIASATRFRTRERSATEVSAQASFAACAASSARSTSSVVERGTSVNGSPVAGVTFWEYSFFTGGTQCPPMKLSYRDFSSTGLSTCPGGAKVATFSMVAMTTPSVWHRTPQVWRHHEHRRCRAYPHPENVLISARSPASQRASPACVRIPIRESHIRR